MCEGGAAEQGRTQGIGTTSISPVGSDVNIVTGEKSNTGVGTAVVETDTSCSKDVSGFVSNAEEGEAGLIGARDSRESQHLVETDCEEKKSCIDNKP